MAPTHPDTSSERLAVFPFKPVDTEPKMSEWPGEYIAKRNSVTTKRATLSSSGLEISYFEDGPGPATVLAIHGMGSCKWTWLLNQLPPGVRLIAMDRLSHGASSRMPATMRIEEEIAAYEEFTRVLGLGQFYIIGHSAGTFYSQCLASRICKPDPSRLLGLALLGVSPEISHPRCSDAATQQKIKEKFPDASALGRLSRPGCMGGLSRWVLKLMISGMVFKDKAKDPGFADWWRSMPTTDGCEKPQLELFARERFLVAAYLDGMLHGAQNAEDSVRVVAAMYQRWPDDAADICGPSVTMYHGTADKTLPPLLAELAAAAIPGSELVWLPGHGHSTMFVEYPRILAKLVRGGGALGE